MDAHKINTQNLAVAGMFTAIGIILPYATAHAFGIQGTVMLPIHIPVLIMGLISGPVYGAFGGIIIPVLNTLFTGMPPAFPMLPIMMCELFTYGTVSGLIFYKTKIGLSKYGIYAALVISMICGRIAYGTAFYLMTLWFGGIKALGVFSAFVTGLPGIAVQLLFIPPIVRIIKNASRKRKRSVREYAVSLIKEDAVSCVVIREGKITKTKAGNGIAPLIELYEEGELRNAYVIDKIIGKAAAMILAAGGAEGCHGVVMSSSALKLLKEHGIKATCEITAEAISNRSGDGICPMEKAVMDICDPHEGYKALKNKLDEIRGQQIIENP